MLKASRHSEMDEEVAATLELENQILATTTYLGDALSFQRGCDCLRRLGPGQAVVCNGHPREATPDQRGREPRADRLDLGKLRHAASLAATRRRDSHAEDVERAVQRSTSRTIGTGSGLRSLIR